MKDKFLGKILWKTKYGRSFNGLCPNKLGNIVYETKKDGGLKIASNRPFLVFAFEIINLIKYYWFMRIQNFDFTKKYGKNYNHGMYKIIDEKFFRIDSSLDGMPEKKSILYFDTLFRIDEKTLNNLIDVDDILFINTRKMTLKEQQSILKDVIYFMDNNKEHITLLTIKPEKLFDRYKTYSYFDLGPQHLTTNKIFDEHKIYYYKNIADVEYTTISQIEKTNNFDNNVINDNFLYVNDTLNNEKLYKNEKIFYNDRNLIFNKNLEIVDKKIWTPNNELEK